MCPGKNKKNKELFPVMAEVDEWEAEVTERRLTLVLDDIGAAEKQLASLAHQRLELSKKLKNVDFEIEEVQCKLTIFDSAGHEPLLPTDSIKSEGFFSILKKLENEQAGLASELQSYTELQRDLLRERQLLLHKNKDLKSNLDSNLQRLSDQQAKLRALSDDVKNIYVEVDSKLAETQLLQLQCDDVKRESIETAERLAKLNDEISLKKKQEADNSKQLSDLRKKGQSLKENLGQAERFRDRKTDRAAAEAKEVRKLSAWYPARQILMQKLRKSREGLIQAKSDMRAAERRKELIAEKFRKALGVEDATGEGEIAKSVILSEIEEIEGAVDADLLRNIKVETEMGRELSEEVRMLEESAANFERHRKGVMRELEMELMESSMDGYIKLLHEDLNALKAVFGGG
jgi:hypothetical protein